MIEVTVLDEAVDVFEAVDALEFNDEEELLLVTTFLCGMNILETSSLLIAVKPPPFEREPSQVDRGRDVKVGGEATMVVIGEQKEYSLDQ